MGESLYDRVAEYMRRTGMADATLARILVEQMPPPVVYPPGHDAAMAYMLAPENIGVTYHAAREQVGWPVEVILFRGPGEYDESKHKRGQPGNSGQFGPGGSGGGGGDPGSGRATTSKPKDRPAPPLNEADRAELLKGIDADLADYWDGPEPSPGLVAKAKDVALTVAARSYVWATQATHSRAMGLLAEGLAAYFDLPSDMAKLGYNPGNSSGTANPKTADAVSALTTDLFGQGVSGHLVASVASKVVVKAAYWIKSRVQGSEPAAPLSLASILYELPGEPDGYFEWAEFIATVLDRVATGMGVTDKMPGVGTVEMNLRAMLQAGRDRTGRATTDYAAGLPHPW